MIWPTGDAPDLFHCTDGHAHQTIFTSITASNATLLVTDLGKDAIYKYNVSTRDETGDITLKPLVVCDARSSSSGGNSSIIELEKGAGPRHVAFSPTSKTIYIMNELDSTIAVISLDTHAMKVIDVMPSDYDWKAVCGHRKGGADIKVSEDGRYVYASLRNPNMIVTLKVSKSDETEVCFI